MVFKDEQEGRREGVAGDFNVGFEGGGMRGGGVVSVETRVRQVDV